jgi:hypothetical protein
VMQLANDKRFGRPAGCASCGAKALRWSTPSLIDRRTLKRRDRVGIFPKHSRSVRAENKGHSGWVQKASRTSAVPEEGDLLVNETRQYGCRGGAPPK